jgi:hypothetical protein
MFIELTSKEELMEWLPKLVGIEHAAELRIGDDVVRARPDPEHEKQLTRDTVTASVHYVHFDLTPEDVEHFATAPVSVAVSHPNYAYRTELSEPERASLLDDLRG